MTARHSPLFTLESGQSGLGFYTSGRDAAGAQRRWRYGLRACGNCLQLALVEERGPARELWELELRRGGQLIGWRDDGLRLGAAQLSDHLMEVVHAG